HANVRFKELGLIIVDEEHRFGVRDKEKLKTLRAEVHVLTLTATPIPRTLNMALGGLRALSLITTPPAERLAIKTFVTEWHAPTLREACLREFRRGGQVYFVHNVVETIDKTAQEIAKLIPEADVRVGHGQMRERDLERLMVDFYHRRFNLLVCTTIIESGSDVPTANTIMIDRADRLGLAQLHQLRGRVGRSHHQGYAYLGAPPMRAFVGGGVEGLRRAADASVVGRRREAARGDRVARGARLRVHARDARSRDSRRRRAAWRGAKRPDSGDRLHALQRALVARGCCAARGPRARSRGSVHARTGDRDRRPRADSRGLHHRRAHAPRALQANRERELTFGPRRATSGAHRPLRPLAADAEDAVRDYLAQAAR